MEEATERGLRDSLGESAAKAVLFHLAMENFGDVDELHSKLVGLLDRGALALESVILGELSSTMGEQLRRKDDDFVKCVLRAKKLYDKRIGRG